MRAGAIANSPLPSQVSMRSLQQCTCLGTPSSNHLDRLPTRGFLPSRPHGCMHLRVLTQLIRLSSAEPEFRGALCTQCTGCRNPLECDGLVEHPWQSPHSGMHYALYAWDDYRPLGHGFLAGMIARYGNLCMWTSPLACGTLSATYRWCMQLVREGLA